MDFRIADTATFVGDSYRKTFHLADAKSFK